MSEALPSLRLVDIYMRKLRQMNHQELHRLLSGKPQDAAIWIRIAANAGISEAQLRLGRMLLAGDGLPQDQSAAFAWFARAAATDDADALNMLGRCYENGWGVDINPPLAFEHFLRAAQRGHDWAQYNLGHCYLNGIGVRRNPFQAFICYRQAAEQGHSRAMNLLGRCYEEGWGVSADIPAAQTWYRKSAENGCFRGQYNWACMLTDAGKLHAAAEWFLLAAKNGTLKVRRAVARVLLANRHPEFKSSALIALEYCCELGEAEDFYQYGQALQLGVAKAPEPEKAAYWLQRAKECEASC